MQWHFSKLCSCLIYYIAVCLKNSFLDKTTSIYESSSIPWLLWTFPIWLNYRSFRWKCKLFRNTYISEGTNFDKLFFNTDTVTAKKFYIQFLEKRAGRIKIPKKILWKIFYPIVSIATYKTRSQCTSTLLSKFARYVLICYSIHIKPKIHAFTLLAWYKIVRFV